MEEALQAVGPGGMGRVRNATSWQILGLAVPMALEMSLQSFVMLVDVFFVARLGGDAVATVGLGAVALALFLTIAWGLGEGTVAMVARRIGEREPAAAARVATTALVLGGVAGVVFGLVGALYSGRFLALMGASADLVESGTTYVALILGGSFPLWLLAIGNSVLRAVGDPRLALRVLVFANVFNLALDPCLIFGWGPFPELGLTGAAVATLIGWSAGALYLFWLLMRGRGQLQLFRGQRWFDRSVMTRLVSLAGPAIGGYLAVEFGFLLLVRLVAIFGSTALAAFTLCTRFQIAEGMSTGLGNAAKTLTGQSLGAGEPARAESVAWRIGRYNLVALTAIGGFYVFLGKPLLGLFSDDPQVIALARQCQLWVCCGFAFRAFGDVLGEAFVGAGDTATPALVNTGGLWLCQLPLAYFLSHSLGFGAEGVFAALGISQCLLGLALIALFQRGAWKMCQV